MPIETKDMVAIVDDELSVRRFIARVLSRAGYRTLEARSAIEAKELIQTHKPQIALVIADIRMPGGNGLDLAVDLEAADMPVLFISGLIDSVAVKSILLNNPLAILTKPFTPEDLVERVHVLVGSVLLNPTHAHLAKDTGLAALRKGPEIERGQPRLPRFCAK